MDDQDRRESGPAQDQPAAGGPEQKADGAEQKTEQQRPKSRRSGSKNVGPWEWNWHPEEPQPTRSISPTDLSEEERARLEGTVRGLDTSPQAGSGSGDGDGSPRSGGRES